MVRFDLFCEEVKLWLSVYTFVGENVSKTLRVSCQNCNSFVPPCLCSRFVSWASVKTFDVDISHLDICSDVKYLCFRIPFVKAWILWMHTLDDGCKTQEHTLVAESLMIKCGFGCCHSWTNRSSFPCTTWPGELFCLRRHVCSCKST